MFLKKREWQWATQLPVCKGSGTLLVLERGGAAGAKGRRQGGVVTPDTHTRFRPAEAPQPSEI